MRTYLLILGVVIPQFFLAQNCFPDFNYVRSLAIYNDSGDTIMAASLPFTLDTGALLDSAKIQADGADVRIVDQNCDPVPFFMDSTANSSVNNIWVKVPMLLPNDTIQLEIYYGNENAAPAANGQETFLFFDDFSGDTVDLDRWEPIGGFDKLRIVNGVMEYASNGMNPGPRFKFVRTKMSFTDSVLFEFNAEISNSNGIGFSNGDSTIQRIIFRQTIFGFDTLNQVAYMQDTISNGSQVEGLYPVIRFPRRQPTNGRIQAGIVDNLLTLDEFTNLDDSSSNTNRYQLTQSPMGSFHFILSSFLGSQTIYLDYLRVRKIIPSEIGFEIGEEVNLNPNTSNTSLIQDQISIYPQPAINELYIKGLPIGSYELRIVNSLGQLELQQKFTAQFQQPKQISIEQLPAGWHMVQIRNGEGPIFQSPISKRK
ncbi:MAG: DUF2341 domain-containing protein [Bacteroidota bacterium]